MFVKQSGCDYLHRHPIQLLRMRNSPAKRLEYDGVAEDGISERLPILLIDDTQQKRQVFDFIVVELIRSLVGHGCCIVSSGLMILIR